MTNLLETLYMDQITNDYTSFIIVKVNKEGASSPVLLFYKRNKEVVIMNLNMIL